MGHLLIIDAVAATVVLGIWYFCFARLNRRRGLKALHSVEAACDGRGRVLETKWLGNSKVQARLAFAVHWFENVQITVRLLPRPLPFQWLLSLWRREKETVTFEADLDYSPRLRLDVLRHRWLSQSRSSLLPRSRNWTISHPGPVVLTTRSQWTHELPAVVNTLMTSRGHNLLSVRFRPDCPQLAATVALEDLADGDTAAAFLNVLQDLAAGASTSTQ